MQRSFNCSFWFTNSFQENYKTIQKKVLYVIFYAIGFLVLLVPYVKAADYGRISGNRAYNFLEEFVASTIEAKNSGIVNYGRIAGTSVERKSIHLLYETLKDLPLDNVLIEEFPLGASQLKLQDISLTLSSADGQTLNVSSVFTEGFVKLTEPGGIIAEIVDAGYASDASRVTADFTGKIVFIRVPVKWAVFGHQGQNILRFLVQEKKAAGIIMSLEQPHTPATRYAVWGGSYGADVSWVTVNGEDGKKISEFLNKSAREGAHAKLLISGEYIATDQAATANVLAYLKGASTNVILFTAHTDSVFTGATDNASGVAVLTELARYFSSSPKEQRKNTLIFVGTAGHHSGPAVGVKHLIANHPEIVRNVKLVINLEHMASLNPSRSDSSKPGESVTRHGFYVTRENPTIEKLVREAMMKNSIPLSAEPNRKYIGDLYPWKARGVLGLCLMQPSYWYHTEADTTDKISPEALGGITRAIAKIVDSLSQIPLERWQ